MTLEKQEKLIKLGRFVRTQRILKNLTTCQIENTNGIDRAFWSKLENGKLPSIPKPEMLKQIAGIIGVNLLELFLLAGYIEGKDIQEHVAESHRIREKDHARKSAKP